MVDDVNHAAGPVFQSATWKGERAYYYQLHVLKYLGRPGAVCPRCMYDTGGGCPLHNLHRSYFGKNIVGGELYRRGMCVVSKRERLPLFDSRTGYEKRGPRDNAFLPIRPESADTRGKKINYFSLEEAATKSTKSICRASVSLPTTTMICGAGRLYR